MSIGMKRRNFLKSSVFLSGMLMASAPRWAVGQQTRFGFYYPTYVTPESINEFVGLFQRAGIDASVESLIDQDLASITKQLQSGHFAGVFVSSGLVAEKIRALQLFSDGPDLPAYKNIQSWAAQHQVQWDQLLQSHNLKRIPFVNIGARRGVWVNPDWISKKQCELRGAKVFATGIWAELLQKQGAEIVFRYDNPSQIDLFFLSNVFAATKTNIHNDRPYDEISAAGFDLFLNTEYWHSLSTRAQQDVQKYTTEIGGARVSAIFKDIDERMLPSYDQKQLRIAQLPALAEALKPELAREIRQQAVAASSVSEIEKQLLQNFDAEFPLKKITKSLT
jgi:hypothetical protein